MVGLTIAFGPVALTLSILVVVVTWGMATAVSRLYLGYHWATDALASVSLSLVILGAVIDLDTHRTVRVSEAP
jgi:membrane-associated phospholipid phosphatase